jgi:hypothetical protein
MIDDCVAVKVKLQLCVVMCYVHLLLRAPPIAQRDQNWELNVEPHHTFGSTS